METSGIEPPTPALQIRSVPSGERPSGPSRAETSPATSAQCSHRPSPWLYLWLYSESNQSGGGPVTHSDRPGRPAPRPQTTRMCAVTGVEQFHAPGSPTTFTPGRSLRNLTRATSGGRECLERAVLHVAKPVGACQLKCLGEQGPGAVWVRRNQHLTPVQAGFCGVEGCAHRLVDPPGIGEVSLGGIGLSEQCREAPEGMTDAVYGHRSAGAKESFQGLSLLYKVVAALLSPSSAATAAHWHMEPSHAGP